MYIPLSPIALPVRFSTYTLNNIKNTIYKIITFDAHYWVRFLQHTLHSNEEDYATDPTTQEAAL